MMMAEWGYKFLPHYFHSEPGKFHLEIEKNLSELHTKRGSKLAFVAPRGFAKSTWVTTAYTLRSVLEGWEPYVIILSDSSRQAEKYLFNIKEELESNRMLAEAYPESVGIGKIWNSDSVHMRNGCVIEALGAGKKIRGRKVGQHRPSLIILDDIQSNDDIYSKLLRDQAFDWVTREVMPAGDERTNFISVGTALHRECVACQLLTMPRWSGRVFKAIEKWPKNMNHWLEWERIAANISDENRTDKANQYFKIHEPEMLEGSEILWESYKPLVELMWKRVELGPSVFETEYQGNPKSSTGSEWPSEYFEGILFDEWPSKLTVKASTLDPSKAQSDRKGDYQAHVWGGIDAKGTIWIDAELKRETVHEMISRAIQRNSDLCNIGGPTLAGSLIVETNIFGELLALEFEKQIAETGGRILPILPVENYEKKNVRIRKIDGPLSRRQIRIKNTVGGNMLLDQLKDFPYAGFDDGPDALSMLVERLFSLSRSTGPQTGNWKQSPLGYDIRKQTY